MTFSFSTVPEIVSDDGASGRTGAWLAARGLDRVFIVTDAGVRAAGLLQSLELSLHDNGIARAIFDGVQADPPEQVVLAAAAQARGFGAKAVIGIGGGSSLDVAKLAAYLARQDQPLAEIYGVEKALGARLPLVQIPTTAGTGSEVTPIAIVTTGASEKMGVVSRVLYADLAVLDVGLTLGLPAPATAATGIDAMVHAIEAYTSRHRKNPLSDALAEKALVLLAGNLDRVLHHPSDRQARAAMLAGSCFAGMAFANAPVAAVHALAYPLGGHFHLAHGLTNALVLPHVLRFNLEAAAPLYARLGEVLGEPAAADPMAGAERFVVRMEALLARSGLALGLSHYGVTAQDLPLLADDAMKQTRLLVNNPKDVTRADALAIYERALA